MEPSPTQDLFLMEQGFVHISRILLLLTHLQQLFPPISQGLGLPCTTPGSMSSTYSSPYRVFELTAPIRL